MKSAERRSRVWPALLASGLFGFVLGVLFPAWHVAIEPAQVAAGLVSYPEGNPYALYQTRVWNLWHQLLAPLLAAGVPERTLSFAVSGAVGAITFAAMSCFALAMGASAPLALAAPLLAWFFNPMVMRWGFNYPILLVGYGHTYGMVGIAWLVLACGALGLGRFGVGAFLIGVGPALHVSLGAWLGLLAGLSALTMPGRLRPHLGVILRGGAGGVAVAGASLALHQLGRGPEPSIEPAEAARYLDAFVHLWDAHRGAPAIEWNLALLVTSTALAVSLAVRRGRELRAGALLALRVFAAAALLGIALATLLHLVPAREIPNALLIAMPTRLLNFPVLAYVPLVLGVLWAHRQDPIARVTLAVFAVAAVLWPRANWLEYVCVPGAGVVAIALVWRGPRERKLAGIDPLLVAVTLLAIGFGVTQMATNAIERFPVRAAKIFDRSTDAALEAASRTQGLLAVAPGISTAQAITRRPLVLDPMALDMLPYAIGGAKQMERILAELYGIEFFDPPASALQGGVVPADVAKQVWEARAEREWIATASSVGFTHVLVPARWTIRLPLVAKSDVYALYRVPTEGPSGSQ